MAIGDIQATCQPLVFRIEGVPQYKPFSVSWKNNNKTPSAFYPHLAAAKTVTHGIQNFILQCCRRSPEVILAVFMKDVALSGGEVLIEKTRGVSVSKNYGINQW